MRAQSYFDFFVLKDQENRCYKAFCCACGQKLANSLFNGQFWLQVTLLQVRDSNGTTIAFLICWLSMMKRHSLSKCFSDLAMVFISYDNIVLTKELGTEQCDSRVQRGKKCNQFIQIILAMKFKVIPEMSSFIAQVHNMTYHRTMVSTLGQSLIRK